MSRREDEPFWIKPIVGAVSAVAFAVSWLAFERVGDAWSHRGDDKSYESEEQRTAARDFAMSLTTTAAGLVVRKAEVGVTYDIPQIDRSQNGPLYDAYGALANASRPGGQPSDEIAFEAHRYDLEWNGYPGDDNEDAPEEHCISAALPDDAIGFVATQRNGERATATLKFIDGAYVVKLCQYGRDNTPRHHEVAVAGLPLGSG